MNPIKNRKIVNSVNEFENAVAMPTPTPITNGIMVATFLPNLKNVCLILFVVYGHYISGKVGHPLSFVPIIVAIAESILNFSDMSQPTLFA